MPTDAPLRSLNVSIARPRLAKSEQRFRLRQPSQCLQAGVGGNRQSILHEGESGNTTPVLAGEAGDVLDRPRRGDDPQAAVLPQGARRQSLPCRVILSGRSPGKDGCPEEPVVAGDSEIEDRGGDRQNGDRHQENPRPRPSIAAGSECEVIQEAHKSAMRLGRRDCRLSAGDWARELVTSRSTSEGGRTSRRARSGPQAGDP